MPSCIHEGTDPACRRGKAGKAQKGKGGHEQLGEVCKAHGARPATRRGPAQGAAAADRWGGGLRAVAVGLLLVTFAGVRPWLPAFQARAAERPFRAVATTTILADLVRQVAGERWQVDALLPVGTDPHAFEPTPRDARALTGARLAFAVGGGLESGSLVSLLRSTLPAGRVVELAPEVAVRWPSGPDAHHGGEHPGEPRRGGEVQPSAGQQGRSPHGQAAKEPHGQEADEHFHDGQHAHGDRDHAHEDRHAHEDHHHHGELDPHFWTSVPRTIQAVRLIARTLQEADPQGAAGYARRAQAFIGELQALDAWVRRQVAAIAPQRRLLVTNHETLNYFAAEYGFQVVGTVLPSPSRLAEPSAQEAARLVQRLKELGVPAIFTETTVPATLARRLAAEAGVKVVELYSDSLGPAGSGADTYVGYMRTNVRRIVEALNAGSRAAASQPVAPSQPSAAGRR